MNGRLLLVIDSLQIGGAERHLVDVATALHDGGARVEVACSAGGPLVDDLLARRIPLHVLGRSPVKRRTSLGYARALRRVIRRGRPDLVHAHLYASAAAAALATVGTGIPLIVTEQTEAPWRRRRARMMSRFVYGRATTVIAVSDAIRTVLLARYGVAGEKARVVRNSVRPMAPHPRGPGSARTVGTVARLHPEKGLGGLLEAARQIVSAVPEVRFEVVGEGPLKGELEAQAERLGLAERVAFRGGLRDARAIIPSFDVFALPSISEGTPLAIVEAMLAGVPVVASAVGGIPEQIDDGVTGFLVPPRDAAALAAALTRALTDRALAARVADAARARAAVEFSHGTMLDRIRAVYAAAGRPAHGSSTAAFPATIAPSIGSSSVLPASSPDG